MSKQKVGLGIAVVVLGAAGILGCSHGPPVGGPWQPPAAAIKQQQKKFGVSSERQRVVSAIPADLVENLRSLTLADVINIALRNSAETREAWAQAQAARAAYHSRQGSYLPGVSAGASDDWLKTAPSGGRAGSDQHSYSGAVSFTWLLFNFGGRSAGIEETRQALYAAGWSYNAVIQAVLLQVEEAYYGYFAAKGLVEAQQATVDEARANLDAAEERHKAGLATIADVLQARTALSQATLSLETFRGRILTTRGALATAMGLPANIDFDVDLPVGAPPVAEIATSVETYLDTAMQERPDLAAARAQTLAASAHVWNTRAAGWPSLSASGNIGRDYLDDESRGNDSHRLTLEVSIPLFTGFSQYYNVQQARAQADAAASNARSVRDMVTLEVWTSYYNLRTAGERVRTTDDLLASALQNQDVAAGRYKAGVGSILDLLTAQASLENARAQQIQARADWWLAVAQLAHDSGTLEASDLTGAPTEGETGQGVGQGAGQGTGDEPRSEEGKP
jgi:outer membrane protein